MQVAIGNCKEVSNYEEMQLENHDINEYQSFFVKGNIHPKPNCGLILPEGIFV